MNTSTTSASQRLTQSRAQLLQAMRDMNSSASQDWRARQPLRVALRLASDAAKAVLQPAAERHPYGLVLGAAAAGGTLVLTRPWRWTATSAVLAQLMAELVRHVPELLVAAASAARHDQAARPKSLPDR